MKIVHLCQYYMVGHTYQENYLPAAMAKLGHDVVVLAGTGHPDFYDGPARTPGDELFDKGVRVRFLKIRYKSLRTPVDGLYRLLDEEKPDLIFVHGFILTRSFALRRYAGRHPHCVLGADTHETFVLAFNACFTKNLKDRVRRFVYFGCVYRWWRRYVQKRYQKVFYVSPPRKRYAIEAFGFAESDLESLWLGADFATLPYARKEELRKSARAELDLPADARIVMQAGKLDALKRPAELAEAFARLDDPRWYLVYVGSMERDVREAVECAAGGMERLRFTGMVDGDRALAYIAAADIAAYPGAPSVLWQQTVALGVPAIFYEPAEGDADYLSDDSALFVRHGAADEVYEALRALTSDETRLAGMGARARKHAEAVLDYDMLAKKCLDALIAGKADSEFGENRTGL